MMKRYILLYSVALISSLMSCTASSEKKDSVKLASTVNTVAQPCPTPEPVLTCENPEEQKMISEPTLTCERSEKQKLKVECEAWINGHVNRDFLTGNILRKDNPLFVKVDTTHTERNIYLIHPVYEAYKKMYEAALADSVKLMVISGHRTFIEQVYEWELRWDNPRADTVFENDIEKVKYLLQYRSIPGTSRHHWGTDIDLNSFELDYYQSKEGQKVYKWLKENAETFGFFQPYTPQGKKRPTGYNEEKWHWSYKPLSRLMLVKYLELVSINNISGFKGDTAAKSLPIITEWVRGINKQLNEED